MNEMELSLFQKLVMCFCVLSLFLPFYCGGFSLYFWVLCILEFYFISCHVCVCVCVCVWLCTYPCTHMYTHKCMCIYTCTCVCVRMCVCAQLCLTVCDTMGCSPPGSFVHGISQARILEWVAISFSNAWNWKVKVKSLSHVRLFETPWTAAYQAPPSMGFSRQEYWSGVPLPSP